MTGVVSPLVYYLGIEDNKKKVKEYMLASFQKVNKKQRTTTIVEEIPLSQINNLVI